MTHFDPSPGLPDPDRQPEFYSGTSVKRFGAWLIDLLIVSILTLIGVVMTLFTGLFFLPVIWLVMDFAYRVITMTGRSATFGQRLMGIEFRDRTGRRFDLGHAGLHTLGYMVSMSLVIPQVISVVLMLASSRGQSLTDLIMGTAAINRPAA